MALLHGFTGSPASFDRVRERLPEGTVIRCPWLLGHGHGWRSRLPDEVESESEMTRLANEFAAEGECTVDLLGYSLGGRVALQLAVKQPVWLRSLTLIGAHPGLQGAPAREERRKADRRWADLLRREGLAAFVTQWQGQPIFSHSTATSAMKEAERAVRMSHEAEGLAMCMDCLGLGSMASTWDALPSLEVPVRWVAGEGDRKFRDLAQAAAKCGARVRATTVTGAGHNVVLDNPVAVAEIISQQMEAEC